METKENVGGAMVIELLIINARFPCHQRRMFWLEELKYGTSIILGAELASWPIQPHAELTQHLVTIN
jgi:hypothetical protein